VALSLEHETFGVYQDVVLTPLYLLATIVTTLFSAHRGAFDRLRCMRRCLWGSIPTQGVALAVAALDEAKSELLERAGL
jgi:hypothetical protein